MNKNELLKLLILLARYVEIYHESASDDDMNMLSDAYTVVQNKLLGCVDRTMTPVELFDIVDAQCKVAQEGEDVVEVETWRPINVQELARTRWIGCACTEGCQDAAGVYPNNILQVVNKVEQRYADIKLPVNVRLCERVQS